MNWSSDVVCWWGRGHNSVVARFVQKMVFESRVLVGAKSQRFGCSGLRQNGTRKWCVGGSEVRVVVVGVGDNMVFGSRALIGGSEVTAVFRWLALARR